MERKREREKIHGAISEAGPTFAARLLALFSYLKVRLGARELRVVPHNARRLRGSVLSAGLRRKIQYLILRLGRGFRDA